MRRRYSIGRCRTRLANFQGIVSASGYCRRELLVGDFYSRLVHAIRGWWPQRSDRGRMGVLPGRNGLARVYLLGAWRTAKVDGPIEPSS